MVRLCRHVRQFVLFAALALASATPATLRHQPNYAQPLLRDGSRTQSPKMQLPAVIGHRGAKAVAPENTLASIRAAKALGCTWVEVDVMLTKDKVPVIHHDNTLERCTDGKGNVWDYTDAELAQLDAGSHFSPDSAGERIPRLAQLVECCRELKLGLNLEVKHVTEDESAAPSAHEQAMEEELANVVCDTIEKMGVLPSELVFSSFSRCAIVVLRKRLPHFSCAFLVDGIPGDWEEFMQEHECFSLNFSWKNKANSPALIESCTRKVPCYSYTVNEGAVASRLMSLGVKGVFSDCPDLIVDAIRQRDTEVLMTAVDSALCSPLLHTRVQTVSAHQ